MLFSIQDARLLEPGFDRRRLYEWSVKGYIKLLTKGWYIFSDVATDENRLDQIACKLYAPSYISLETMLSRTELLPDMVRSVTSVTTRKTRTIQTAIAKFSYRTLSPRLFFGYDIGSNGVKTACLEKALLDYLYLAADMRTREDFESLRIDREMLAERLDQRRFEEILAKFNIKTLRQRAELFMKWVRHA